MSDSPILKVAAPPGAAVPKWLTLNPTAPRKSLEVSSVVGNFYPLALGKAQNPTIVCTDTLGEK